jgi:hypothetical protein
MICPTGEAKYFCERDSTEISPTGKSAIEPHRHNPALTERAGKMVDYASLIHPAAERRGTNAALSVVSIGYNRQRAIRFESQPAHKPPGRP